MLVFSDQSDTRFKLLGPLEVVHCHEVHIPGPRKMRQTFALLLIRVGRAVSVDALIEELWGEKPPRSAITTLQTYVYHLRKWLELEVPGAGAGHLLVTQSPGYLIASRENQVDANVFEQLAGEGRALLDEGRTCEAAEVLLQALALWRGAPLANVPRGRLLEAHAVRLEELRIEALQLRILADIRLGRHRELIPELRTIVSTYPLNEWFHGQLMHALNKSGRRGEALAAYQNLRRVLSDELGLEPSCELQQLQHEVLTADNRPTSGLSYNGQPALRGP